MVPAFVKLPLYREKKTINDDTKNIYFLNKLWELLVYVLDWPNLTQPMANQKKEKSVSP